MKHRLCWFQASLAFLLVSNHGINAVVQLVLSSVHAVKGLECVVCFVVGLDTKAWRYLPCATAGTDLQQVSCQPM